MDKTQFILSTIPRMAEYTYPYLTSIVGVINPQTGRHLGTGLRCTLSGRQAVVTALHVIEAAQSEPGGFALSAGYAEHPFQVSGRIFFDQEGDLAIYHLPDNYPWQREGIAFWPEDRIERSTDRLATDYLFAHGYPGARSKFLSLVQGVASKSLPYGAMQRLDNLPGDLESFQFALDFDPANMRQPESAGTVNPFVEPAGLSGSPVWRIGISGGTMSTWSPSDCRLVGFLTQWRPNERMLVATLASRLFQICH